jgi:hypothetical protein
MLQFRVLEFFNLTGTLSVFKFKVSFGEVSYTEFCKSYEPPQPYPYQDRAQEISGVPS